MPELYIELYLNEQDNEDLNGKNNPGCRDCDGLKLTISPDDNFINETIDILKNDDTNFPFEFYKYEFNTFQGKSYNGYKRFVNHIFVDNSRAF